MAFGPRVSKDGGNCCWCCCKIAAAALWCSSAVAPCAARADAVAGERDNGLDLSLIGADVRRRFGKGLTRRRVGNSGTSKIGDGVPLYMVSAFIDDLKSIVLV